MLFLAVKNLVRERHAWSSGSAVAFSMLLIMSIRAIT